jgi:hypothetical protein
VWDQLKQEGIPLLRQQSRKGEVEQVPGKRMGFEQAPDNRTQIPAGSRQVSSGFHKLQAGGWPFECIERVLSGIVVVVRKCYPKAIIDTAAARNWLAPTLCFIYLYINSFSSCSEATLVH